MTTSAIQKRQGVAYSEQDEEKFALVDKFLGEAGLYWNRLPVPVELIEAWFHRVRKFRAKAIAKAFDQYLNEEERFPVPGTVIPRIEALPNYLEPTSE